MLESLIASQAVYVSMRPCVNKAEIKNIHELFYLFLWSGKNDKIIGEIIMINNHDIHPMQNEKRLGAINLKTRLVGPGK